MCEHLSYEIGQTMTSAEKERLADFRTDCQASALIKDAIAQRSELSRIEPVLHDVLKNEINSHRHYYKTNSLSNTYYQEASPGERAILDDEVDAILVLATLSPIELLQYMRERPIRTLPVARVLNVADWDDTRSTKLIEEFIQDCEKNDEVIDVLSDDSPAKKQNTKLGIAETADKELLQIVSHEPVVELLGQPQVTHHLHDRRIEWVETTLEKRALYLLDLTETPKLAEVSERLRSFESYQDKIFEYIEKNTILGKVSAKIYFSEIPEGIRLAEETAHRIGELRGVLQKGVSMLIKNQAKAVIPLVSEYRFRQEMSWERPEMKVMTSQPSNEEIAVVA